MFDADPADLLALATTLHGHALAVGSHGAVLFSDDRAQRWTRLPAPAPAALSCCAIDARARLFVGGSVEASAVSDDRRAFVAIRTSFLGRILAAASDARGFVALGEGNALLCEEPDGFVAREIPSAPALGALCVADDDSIFVAGAGGAVLRSVDRGRTWAPCELGSSAEVTALFATSDGGVWAIGAKGLCRRTDDKRAFDFRGPETKRDRRSIWAYGDRVVLVDDDGTASLSANNGASWKRWKSAPPALRIVKGFDHQTLLVLAEALSVARVE